MLSQKAKLENKSFDEMYNNPENIISIKIMILAPHLFQRLLIFPEQQLLENLII